MLVQHAGTARKHAALRLIHRALLAQPVNQLLQAGLVNGNRTGNETASGDFFLDLDFDGRITSVMQADHQLVGADVARVLDNGLPGVGRLKCRMHSLLRFGSYYTRPESPE